jgi:hypothetical protein
MSNVISQKLPKKRSKSKQHANAYNQHGTIVNKNDDDDESLISLYSTDWPTSPPLEPEELIAFGTSALPVRTDVPSNYRSPGMNHNVMIQ